MFLRLKPSDSMETICDCWIQISPLAYKTTGISEGTTILHVNLYCTSRSLQRPRQFSIYGISYATSLTFDSDQISSDSMTCKRCLCICSISPKDGSSNMSFTSSVLMYHCSSYNLIALYKLDEL